MNERRIQRLQSLIQQRVAEVVDQDLSDPRRGLITITRVKLDREMQVCNVFWSILGDEKVQKLNQGMLDHARGYVQREVAAILHTRTVPHVKFVFDESIEGALRIDEILGELREEREAKGEPEPSAWDDDPESPADDPERGDAPGSA